MGDFDYMEQTTPTLTLDPGLANQEKQPAAKQEEPQPMDDSILTEEERRW